LVSKKKIKVLIKNPLGFSEAIIILLLFCFLFAPFITKQSGFSKKYFCNKNYYRHIFGKYIQLKSSVSNSETEIEKFVKLKNSIISIL